MKWMGNTVSKLRKILILSSILMAVAVSGVVAVDAAGAHSRNVLVYDEFYAPDGTDLHGRVPIVAPDGSEWDVSQGVWTIKKKAAIESQGGFWYHVADRRVLIDAAESDVSVTAAIKHKGDQQFVGVAARHDGNVSVDLNWLMFFYDGAAAPSGQERPKKGNLILGAKRVGEDSLGDPISSGAGFQELGRIPFKWKKGKTHYLTLQVDGNEIKAKLNGRTVMTSSDSDFTSATWAGMFSRGEGDARFERFLVLSNDFEGGHYKSFIQEREIAYEEYESENASDEDDDDDDDDKKKRKKGSKLKKLDKSLKDFLKKWGKYD